MISVADGSEQEVGLGKSRGPFQLGFLIILWSSLGVMMSLRGQTRAPRWRNQKFCLWLRSGITKMGISKTNMFVEETPSCAMSSRIHKPVLCPFEQCVPTAPTPWCSHRISQPTLAVPSGHLPIPPLYTQILWSVPDLLTVVSPVYAIFLMSFHLLFLARVLQYLTNLSFFSIADGINYSPKAVFHLPISVCKLVWSYGICAFFHHINLVENEKPRKRNNCPLCD